MHPIPPGYHSTPESRIPTPALPPGPRRLAALDFARATLSAPGPVLQRLAREHGDPFRLSTPAGPVTYTGDPELIRAIYTADPDHFEPAGVEITLPIFGTAGATVTQGARHRRDRKLLSAPFHAAMRAYAATVAEITEQTASRWIPGRPFPMLASTQDLALDIILRVVFGLQDAARAAAVRAAVLRLIESLNPLVFFFPVARHEFYGFGPWSRLLRARESLDALLRDEIRARLAAPPGRQDVLSLLVHARDDEGQSMTEDDLLDQLRTLLFAGHETTAVALTYALYYLHRDPAALARTRAELDALGPHEAPDALVSLPWLEAVCQETLRIRPPVVDVSRTLRRPFHLGPFTIPAGESITPSPLLLHARPDLYPDPDRFRPERFLERKFSPFEYIPFGGGARRCLGAAFAMFELKVALGVLLRGRRLRLASTAPIPHVRRGITLGPRGDVPMILER